MYKGLYDNFSHWFHDGKGTVWFYSDPHFADEDVKYFRGEDHISDEEQIKRINSKIGKYDTLIILGDIGDTEWVKKIRGYKVLVIGNHDSGANNYKRVKQEITINNGSSPIDEGKKVIFYDNHLFDEVYEGALIVSEKLILSHEPVDYPFAFNIHGHTHDLPQRYDDTHWNMCAEAIDYTPVPLNQIIKSGVLKNVTSIHRDTIDRATLRKKNKEKFEI